MDNELEFIKDSEELLAGLAQGPTGGGNWGVGVSPCCPGWEHASQEGSRAVGWELECLFRDCRYRCDLEGIWSS